MPRPPLDQGSFDRKISATFADFPGFHLHNRPRGACPPLAIDGRFSAPSLSAPRVLVSPYGKRLGVSRHVVVLISFIDRWTPSMATYCARCSPFQRPLFDFFASTLT